MRRLLRRLAALARWPLRHPFIVLFLLGGVGTGGIFAWLLHYYDLTVRQGLVDAAQRLGIDSPRLERALAPAPAYPDYVMDGAQKRRHPRILLPQLSFWDGVGRPAVFRHRAAAYKEEGIHAPSPCANRGLLGDTACWVVTGNSDVGVRALGELRSFQDIKPHASGRYGNGWRLALAFDFLALNPNLSATVKSVTEEKLEKALRNDLVLLDGDSASLWHGRATLAADAWLCAVALDPTSTRRRELIRRAQAHFIDVMRALSLVEAWPEGYNYWIQNRAFLLALAASAYVNGLEGATRVNDIRNILNRVGLWTVYATRPDNRIEGYGDEGSRIDLKDETRRVIDLIAQLTGDPVLSTYSRYLGRIGKHESYYRGYLWGFHLFNDPDVKPLATIHPGQLEGLAGVLPRAAIFGRYAMNMTYIRSGWGPEDTFISFHAGDIFTHHGHYDAGHFTVFKGAPLAVNSSVYGHGGFTSQNRLDYSIRTVAKNSLLIMRPGEEVHPNRFFPQNVSGGGQRIVLPTGSGILSVGDWRRNLRKGLHLQAGRLLHFENVKDRYAYVAADLTDAYNTPAHDEGGSGGKAASVKRSLLYLYGEDRLIVFDDVISTRASYAKKWLLHTVERPQVKGLVVLKGATNDGILQSSSREAQVRNGPGYLHLSDVYPKDAVMRLVGGKNYRYYVDIDGNDKTFDGKNFSQGAKEAPWFDNGMWRIEIQPGHPRKQAHFLVVLSPSIDTPRPTPAEILKTNSDKTWALSDPKSLVVFTGIDRDKPLKFTMPGNQQWLYVLGLPSAVEVTLSDGSSVGRYTSSAAGVMFVKLAAGPGTIFTLKWH